MKGIPSQQTSLVVKEHIAQHPFGMYFDYNNWAKRMRSSLASNPADSIAYQASLNTFDNFVLNGGNFENKTFKYQMTINFMDKSESSLLQLIDFGKSMQAAQTLRDEEMAKDQLPSAWAQ